MQIYKRELERVVMQKLPWEKLEGNTIMLSGATGMIGKCFVDMIMMLNTRLKQPCRVIALSRNPQAAGERFQAFGDEKAFRYIVCDVNKTIPECGSIDYVVHAASNTHPMQYSQEPVETILSNVVGTRNLLDYAVSHNAKHFCFLSSVEIYGENRGDVEKFDEMYLGYLNCNTLRAGYPESKRLGETLCNAYKQMYNLEFDIPRLSRVYGPTMRWEDSKAISQFIKNAVNGENIVLKSKGEQRYSYTFVTDAVSGILYSMLLGEGGDAYNVANEESDITLKELACQLADIAGTRVIFECPDEREQRGYSTATKAMLDASKLRSLGWKPEVPMRTGLEETVAYFRARN